MRATRTVSIAFTACSLLTLARGADAQSAPPATPPSQEASVALTASAPLAGPRASTPSAGTGLAATGAHRAAPATLRSDEHTRRRERAIAALNGSDPAAMLEALSTLQELSGRAAADAIIARIHAGLPPQLSERALSVLASLKQPIAAATLSELTLHRRWQIREKAISALGALRVRSSVSVLLYALDDPSPEVRSAAARALGAAGDPRAIHALKAALTRDVDGALEGLAQLVPSQQLDTILARAQSDLVGAEPALWLLLTRKNLPVVTKLKVLSFVEGHPSEHEAAQVLEAWRVKLKQSGELRLLAALSSRPAPKTISKTVSVAVTAPAPAEGAKP